MSGFESSDPREIGFGCGLYFCKASQSYYKVRIPESVKEFQKKYNYSVIPILFLTVFATFLIKFFPLSNANRQVVQLILVVVGSGMIFYRIQTLVKQYPRTDIELKEIEDNELLKEVKILSKKHKDTLIFNVVITVILFITFVSLDLYKALIVVLPFCMLLIYFPLVRCRSFARLLKEL